MGTDVLHIGIREGASLADLRQRIDACLGPDQMTLLHAADVRVAVNQQLVHGGADPMLAAGDEVAFMPPVTGG